MGQIGIWQILIVAVLAVLLFGRGKISQLMGDVAKGINAFKKGMKDGAAEETADKGEAPTIEGAATRTAESAGQASDRESTRG